MNDNKLVIQINKPASEVYAFLLNPKNTPKWIEHLVVEQTNEWPVKVGSIYRNQDRDGKWSEYTLTTLKENEMFEMISLDGNYHVRYSLRPINDNAVELTYYEWVGKGVLDDPFSVEILKKLKLILEA